MARVKFILLLLPVLAACAPSPLHVARHRIGTGGEAPRDGRGEPIWAAINQPALPPAAPAMPVNPGVPVTPPL